jgi:hypothetical protein
MGTGRRPTRRNRGGGDWVGERDERDRERIRWGVEWLRAWMPMV